MKRPAWLCAALRSHLWEKEFFEPMENRPVPPSGKIVRVQWWKCCHCKARQGILLDAQGTYRYTVTDKRPAWINP